MLFRLVEAMTKMAFSARDLGRAAQIYDPMLREKDCAIILCLAGSLISAGLKNVIVDLVSNNMVDAIVSTGAIIVDQDFFEALGFKHYKGDIFMNDDVLRSLAIDRIYDTYIDEDQLRVCDATAAKLRTRSSRAPYSSREFIREMGRYLARNGKNRELGRAGRVRKGSADLLSGFQRLQRRFRLDSSSIRKSGQTSQHRFGEGFS